MANVAVAAACVLGVAACGGGGDGGDASVLGAAAGPVTTVSGKFVSTDGATAMGSALVYAQDAQTPTGAPADSLPCGAPPNPNWPAACTASDGSFSFAAQLSAGAGATLVLSKNGFVQQTALPAGQPATMALGAVNLAPAAAGASIAVVLGDDGMQQTLARLGMGSLAQTSPVLIYGTESFAIFDSEYGQDSVQAFRQYPAWDRLFADLDGDGKADLYKYALLVLNGSQYEKLRADPNHLQTLRDYVNQGGRLITGGTGYYLIEDLWPDMLDWAGVDAPANQPERPNSVPSESTRYPVLGEADTAFAAWLAPLTCTRYLGDYQVGGSCFDDAANDMFVVDAIISSVLPDAYARLLGAHAQSQAQVRTLVAGYADYLNGRQPTHPLAVVMTVGAGRVAYTAFQIGRNGTLPGLTPHERMFQYLVFEM